MFINFFPAKMVPSKNVVNFWENGAETVTEVHAYITIWSGMHNFGYLA